MKIATATLMYSKESNDSVYYCMIPENSVVKSVMCGSRGQPILAYEFDCEDSPKQYRWFYCLGNYSEIPKDVVYIGSIVLNSDVIQHIYMKKLEGL